MLTFDQARAVVFEKLSGIPAPGPVEKLPLEAAQGRVLAAAVTADRDYPPFDRSARDGFAVRAADVANPPARLRLIGETRAGEPSRFTVNPGEAIRHALSAMGFAGIEAVRQGKVIDLDLAETDAEVARSRVAEMCEKLLANTVIEDYRIEIT